MLDFVEHRKFSLTDFEPFVGKLGNERLAPLPNAEDVNPLEFLNNLASGGHGMLPVWGYVLLPDGSRPQWTQLFLTSFMAGSFDGGGYAVTYGGSRYLEGKAYATPIVRRFAICKHRKVDGPGANHSRGWHPGFCELCGMNMTFDSGD